MKLLIPVIRKFGGYVIRNIHMMQELMIEQVKINQLDVHSVVKTLPKIELTEGKSPIIVSNLLTPQVLLSLYFNHFLSIIFFLKKVSNYERSL